MDLRLTREARNPVLEEGEEEVPRVLAFDQELRRTSEGLRGPRRSGVEAFAPGHSADLEAVADRGGDLRVVERYAAELLALALGPLQSVVPEIPSQRPTGGPQTFVAVGRGEDLGPVSSRRFVHGAPDILQKRMVDSVLELVHENETVLSLGDRQNQPGDPGQPFAHLRERQELIQTDVSDQHRDA